jgi:hypothetical protein
LAAGTTKGGLAREGVFFSNPPRADAVAIARRLRETALSSGTVVVAVTEIGAHTDIATPLTDVHV